MIVYQVRVKDKNTNELIEVGSVYDNEEAAKQEQKHLEWVYSDHDTYRITVMKRQVLSEYTGL